LLDTRAVERLDQLVTRQERGRLVLRPSQQRQVVHQRLGQEALLSERLDRRGTVALGQRLAVRAVHLRDVRVGGRRAPERLDHRGVAGRAREQVVAADDVRDAHQHVVDRDRQQEDGRAVRADQDEVAELPHGEAHLALHQVVDDPFPLGHGEPHGERSPFTFERGALRVGQPQTRPSSPPGGTPRDRRCLVASNSAVQKQYAFVGDQPVDDLAVEAGPLRLSVRPCGPPTSGPHPNPDPATGATPVRRTPW
jgi:hypothetical protein